MVGLGIIDTVFLPLREYVQVHQSINEHQAKDAYGTVEFLEQQLSAEKLQAEGDGTPLEVCQFFRD